MCPRAEEQDEPERSVSSFPTGGQLIGMVRAAFHPFGAEPVKCVAVNPELLSTPRTAVAYSA